jgi:hypothetical protein
MERPKKLENIPTSEGNISTVQLRVSMSLFYIYASFMQILAELYFRLKNIILEALQKNTHIMMNEMPVFH